jgi:hypothetical protein
MLGDSEWKLSGAARSRVFAVLVYFVEPEDMIPDRIPRLGYLDDAILIELVAQDLRHDLETYADFGQFRISKQHRRGTYQPPSRASIRSERDASSSTPGCAGGGVADVPHEQVTPEVLRSVCRSCRALRCGRVVGVLRFADLLAEMSNRIDGEDVEDG